MADYLEDIYDETYKIVYSALMDRKETDKNFTKSELEGLLNSCYANEGNNWAGQSEVRLTKKSATIAAYETILLEW